MSSEKVKIIYTGSMSAVVVDALNELVIVRDEPTEVPKSFADEKCKRSPHEWKLAGSTTVRKTKTKNGGDNID